MHGYQAIGDMGRTIVNLLRNNLTPEPIPKPEMIELCAPYMESDYRLTVYLYSIMENDNKRDYRNSVLSLNLLYLITAFSKAEDKSKAYDESCIIGKTMQIMSQHAIIRGSLLQGTLAENNDETKVLLHAISADEMSKIWTFPNVPYKLSIAYMVGPVSIDLSDSKSPVNRVIGY